MDQPGKAPRSRAQTLHDLYSHLSSVTAEQTVIVQSVYGSLTYRIPPPPDLKAELGIEPEPPRLTPMEACILEAAADAPSPLTGEELAKCAGYRCHAGVRSALSSLRRRGLLGGVDGRSGYPITSAGRQALSP